VPDPALEVAILVVLLDPVLEGPHGVGEPRAELGEEPGADADHAEQGGAEALPALLGGLGSLDGVVEELLQVPGPDGALQAVREGGHGVAPGASPGGDPGVQDRDECSMEAADVVCGTAPDAVGDGVPELLPVGDDLGEAVLEVLQRPAHDE